MNKIKRDSDVTKMYDMLLVLKKQCNEFNNFSIGKLLFKCGYNNKKNIVSALESLNVISVERSKNNKNLYYWTYKGRVSHFDARTILYRIFDLNSGKKLNKCVDPLIEAEPISTLQENQSLTIEALNQSVQARDKMIKERDGIINALQKAIEYKDKKIEELVNCLRINENLLDKKDDEIEEFKVNLKYAENRAMLQQRDRILEDIQEKKHFKIRKSIVYVVLTLLFYILAFTYALFYHNLI